MDMNNHNLMFDLYVLMLCCFWQIHYDRFGMDGLFSHKEITVLFLSDLSKCMPLLDLWRSQWLAHMKDVLQRERQIASKQKVCMAGRERCYITYSDIAKDRVSS